MALYATTGTINIGSMGKDFLAVTTKIIGKKYGVQISGDGTLNYGDGGIFGGNVTFESGTITGVTSNAIYATTVGTTITIGNTSIDVTADEYYLPIL